MLADWHAREMCAEMKLLNCITASSLRPHHSLPAPT